MDVFIRIHYVYMYINIYIHIYIYICEKAFKGAVAYDD